MAGKYPFQTIFIRASSLALIMLIFLGVSCEREDDREFVEVWLEIPFTIEPPSSTIELGDTLWIEATFPDTVHDYLTKKYYKVPNYDFFTSIVLLRLVSNSLYLTQQPAGAAAFDFYFHTGTIIDIGSLGGKLKFEYNDNNYQIKFGLITKHKGIYLLSMIFRESGNVVPVIETQLNSNKKIVYVMYHMNYLMNGGYFHYELFEANVKTVYDHRADPDFERTFNGYCFEVL